MRKEFLLICTFCKKEFSRTWKDNRIENCFCSKSCAASYNNQKFPKREKTKQCKNCNNKIYSDVMFCKNCISNKEHLKDKNRKYYDTDTHRECPRCSIIKPISDFYNRRDRPGKLSYCKLCTSDQTLERRQIFKQLCVNYKGNKCIMCGYNKYIGALEFHHLDPKCKDFYISHSKLWSFNEKVIKELDKCSLLCSNCHKEEHNKIKQNRK